MQPEVDLLIENYDNYTNTIENNRRRLLSAMKDATQVLQTDTSMIDLNFTNIYGTVQVSEETVYLNLRNLPIDLAVEILALIKSKAV